MALSEQTVSPNVTASCDIMSVNAFNLALSEKLAGAAGNAPAFLVLQTSTQTFVLYPEC